MYGFTTYSIIKFCMNMRFKNGHIFFFFFCSQRRQTVITYSWTLHQLWPFLNPARYSTTKHIKWPLYFVTHYNHAFWSIGPLILLFFVIITYLCINWFVFPSWRRQWGLWWWGMAVVWWRWECSMPNLNLPSSKSQGHGEFSKNLYPTSSICRLYMYIYISSS